MRCAGEVNIFHKIQSQRVVIIKTIISDEMLFEDQKEAFSRLVDQLEDAKNIKMRVIPFDTSGPTF